jgi:hypothetical protein
MDLDRRRLGLGRHRRRMCSSCHRSRPVPLADRTQEKKVWIYRYQEVVEGCAFNEVTSLVKSDFLGIHERHGVLTRR